MSNKSRPWLSNELNSDSDFTVKDSSYHRSKIFQSELGVNPLLQNAAPLFSLVKCLKYSEDANDAPLLLQNLIHEIKAFEDKVKCHDYDQNTILASRYLLCSFLDEIILESEWALSNNWQQDNLITHFYKGNQDEEGFFQVVEKALRDSRRSLDLLELIYLILSLGFQGKYKDEPKGDKSLNELSTKIYDVIRSERGEFSRTLLIKVEPNETLQKLSKVKKRSFSFSRWIVIALALIFVGGFYFVLKLHTHSFLG